MRQLSIKDCQNRLLNIAKIVNGICQRNNISLFMLGGTMLGAIRHKGFIPWDDDMDFGVIYDDYVKLERILKRELPQPLVCTTYENSNAMHSFFLKVEDKSTVTLDPDSLFDQLGINLDIFPLVPCSIEEWNKLIPRIRAIQSFNRRVYIGSTEKKPYKQRIKRILSRVFPISSVSFNRRIKKLIGKIKPGDYYYNVASPHFWNKPLPHCYFAEKVYYEFEDTAFLGVSDYDAYLKTLYKDYMVVPPLEKQVIHHDMIFEK